MLVVLATCCATGERKLVDPLAWSEPRDGVAVSRSGIRIGSKTLNLPTTAANLSDILGTPDRTVANANRILIWDHLGIFAYESPKTLSIHALSISFTCTEFEFCPEHGLPGVFVVGGAVFRRAPDTRDMIRNHFRTDEFTCLKNIGKYQVSADCIAAGPGLGTFEVELK